MSSQTEEFITAMILPDILFTLDVIDAATYMLSGIFVYSCIGRQREKMENVRDCLLFQPIALRLLMAISSFFLKVFGVGDLWYMKS